MKKENVKRSKAKSLFITNQYTQKEIAELVGVSEKTVSKWKEQDGWESFKMSLLTTRENELRRLYKMLQKKNDEIELKLIVTPGDMDGVLKLTAAIKNLELETSIADKVEVGTSFINLVRKENADLAKQITKWFDIFLQQTIK